MTSTNICPTCAHANEVDAGYCINCGTLLVSSKSNITTVPITDSDLGKVTPREPATPALGLNSLVLFVAGDQTPIVIQDEDEVVLGRNVPENGYYVVDLGVYQVEGVSRQHAAISAVEDGYTVMDLQSTNGTWLNGTLLLTQTPYQLRSGDQLRLGKLTIYVYFQSGQSPA